MNAETSVPVKAPFFRRLSTVVVMTVTLLPMPIAALLIITGPIFRKRPEGWRPISNKARYIYGGALVAWLVAATIKAMMAPGGIEGEWERSADPALGRSTQNTSSSRPTSNSTSPEPATAPSTAISDGLPTCDNPEVIQTAREAIDESPAGVTMGLRVRDVGKGQETFFQPERKLRRCVAEVMLNSGSSLMTYQVLYGPSGNLMVQAQVGDAAVMQHEVDKARKEEAEAASRPRDCTPHIDNLTGKEVFPYGCEEQRIQAEQAAPSDPGAEPQGDTANR
jgi:hypothetical protein